MWDDMGQLWIAYIEICSIKDAYQVSPLLERTLDPFTTVLENCKLDQCERVSKAFLKSRSYTVLRKVHRGILKHSPEYGQPWRSWLHGGNLKTLIVEIGRKRQEFSTTDKYLLVDAKYIRRHTVSLMCLYGKKRRILLLPWEKNPSTHTNFFVRLLISSHWLQKISEQLNHFPVLRG